MEELETPANNGGGDLITFSDDFDSACSTPFVSAPSSPGRGPPSSSSYGGGFFYSAPASPIHFMLSSNHSSSSSISSTAPLEGGGGSFEFGAAHGGAAPTGSMSSADELFLNGRIRPMKLSSHLQRPQDDDDGRGRVLRARDRSKSLRRRARSMSPLRTNNAFQWLEEFEDGRESTEINEIKKKLEAEEEEEEDNKAKLEDVNLRDAEMTPSGASSRVVLGRPSKSEGRSSTSSHSNSNHKFWTSLSFSPSSSKEKKSSDTSAAKNKATATGGTVDGSSAAEGGKTTARKAVNGVGKRRVARSAHELHYTTNRAQAEELRKKTYLPYKQGLLGCLGFSSKSYGAMNGFARALNPVSSR
ncbi:hypothetical protein OSB04_016692 [Centaurea solstitialis]|uniref:Stress response NST1-like protein n=1 Tax=Centaurea solstitialis TaxID=347529 RepID=A0AA38WA15_9ASTR|nr:hypothetical protein OSB04_016692 [Centaurea solstitialis]